jgi:hypothetical protein
MRVNASRAHPKAAVLRGESAAHRHVEYETGKNFIRETYAQNVAGRYWVPALELDELVLLRCCGGQRQRDRIATGLAVPMRQPPQNAPK